MLEGVVEYQCRRGGKLILRLMKELLTDISTMGEGVR